MLNPRFDLLLFYLQPVKSLVLFNVTKQLKRITDNLQTPLPVFIKNFYCKAGQNRIVPFTAAAF